MNKPLKIKLSAITFGDRLRSDYGDIENLASSIKKRGLITAITVERINKEKYLLLAGGRRFKACEFLKLESISAIVYEDLTPEERRLIELEENIKRQDLSFVEVAAIRTEIHNLKVKEAGGKGKVGPKGKGDKKGWTRTDTANLLSVAKSTVTESLQIDEAVKAGYTEVAKAPTKDAALKIVAGLNEKGIVTVTEEKSKVDLIILGVIRDSLKNCYILDKDQPVMGTAPEGKWDFIEINVDNLLDHIHIMTMAQLYIPFLTVNGWLMLTNLSYPPLEYTKKETIVQAIWVWQQQKGDNHLLNQNYENLIFISKNKIIQEKGRSNIFQCNKPKDENIIHLDEHPIELMELILKTFVPPRGKVFIPRVISGNTILAAVNLEMQAVGYGNNKIYKALYDKKVDSSEPQKYRSLI